MIEVHQSLTLVVFVDDAFLVVDRRAWGVVFLGVALEEDAVDKRRVDSSRSNANEIDESDIFGIESKFLTVQVI